MTISEKKFLCSKCNKTFPHQRALDQHLNSKHTTNSTTPNGIKNIGCPHCNKLFVSKSAQDHHIFSKHENKLLTCPNCSKKFKSQAGLTQHQKAVHQIPTKKNTEKSQKKSTDKETIWIQCPYCQELQAEQKLKKHITKYHQFACPHCTESLNSQERLKHHITKHHKDKAFISFICDKCKKAFGSERDLSNHTQIVHVSSQIHYLQPEKKDKVELKKQESMWSSLKIIGLREEGRKKKSPMEQIIRSLNLAKKIVIMDECVGNDTLVIEALDKDYDVRSLPKELKGRSDEYIRTILELNEWGLVSIDYNMAMRANEMGISPIFLIINKPNRRDMTMVSDGTYRLK